MHDTTTLITGHRAEEPLIRDDPRTARCADLAAVVGHLAHDDDLFTGSLLSAAVNELAAQAGRIWRFDPATNTALLLRALSKLSIHAPDASSTSAAVLLDTHHTMGAAS